MPPTQRASAQKRRVNAQLRPAEAVEERPPVSTSGRKEKAIRIARIVLDPDQSAALREQLLTDIGQLQSADDAADWVHKNLAAKNTLIDATLTLSKPVFVKGSQRSRQRPLRVRERQVRGRQEMRLSDRGAFPHRDGRRQRQLRSSCPGAANVHVAVASRRKPFACATRSTANSSPLSPASSAAGRPRRRITFASLNRARSAERSATNTQSPSAVSITGSCTATATRPHGGPRSASTRCRSLSDCGEDLARTMVHDAESSDLTGVR